MKSAIVTGGAGGIGASICEALSAEEYRVGVLDFDGEGAKRMAARLRHAVALQADITSESSVAEAVHAFGSTPDLLVNNAGITGKGGMSQDLATFRRILEVNLVGAYIVTQAIAPQMRKRGSGAIVNVTSIAATTANPAGGAYGPSKAALANLTRAMALELAPAGVRVNAVAPGMINSGLGAGPASDPEVLAERIAMVPAGHLGAAADIAAAVVFLASDGARYIHGQEIVVDGALTISMLARVGKSGAQTSQVRVSQAISAR